MKKIICLLMLLFLCLSLCACGKKAETVEITTENWEEYFTLTYVDTWSKNEFGDFDDVKIDAILTLKPAYAEKMAENQSTPLLVDFACDGAVKGVDIDFAAQTYTLLNTRKVEPFRETFTINVSQLNEPYVLSQISLEPATVEGIRYIMVCENAVINRIEGTLCFYTE